MPTVDDYIASVEEPHRTEFTRIRSIVLKTLPDIEQGTSYGMPAYLHKGKPLISFVVNKKFLSIYPFSGKVIDILQDMLKDFECTSGSIHFTAEKPLSAALLENIIRARTLEIEGKNRNE